MRIRYTSVVLQRISILLLIVLCAVREWQHIGCHPVYHCEAWAHSLLFKSKETFKLAEIQNLEASLQTKRSEYCQDDLQDDDLVLRYNLIRLLVDRATGSSLFRLDLQSKGGKDKAFSNVKSDNNTRTWPFSESENSLRSELLSLSCVQRCDWIGQVLEEGDDPTELVKNLQSKNCSTKSISKELNIDEWNLDYIKLMGEVASRTKPTYTMKSLLCAIAHEIPSRPSLNPSLVKNRLLIVDTASKGSNSTCFLVRCMENLPNIEDKSPQQLKWAQRPFQYSSAINYEVAEMAVEILITLCDNNIKRIGKSSKDERRILLDPTCGSGTFLALAMAKGFHVEGYDINPSVAEGAVCNLEYLFGEEKVEKFVCVETRDSCSPWRDNELLSRSGADAVISCVVANLPWGRNSILYVDENKRILLSVRSQIQVGTPCVFITRPSDSGDDKGPLLLFESAGFNVLEQAFVPQRDFLLPTSKKKKKNPRIGNIDNDRDKQNQCVITVVLAK
mmetsp:Transcript_4330/g.9349  ORF Transcript_4330/g.9349 Transcript_4330/m.9349 type:complete len:504 (+) Transcript_4330:111-1622(+)|eukprot:CAMPEP_0168167368 /NCGR_PEP_ID=MMETSP0139_2-20121125/2512_1 /TAXON_ID=44445 /ORGANISM="Pseudo-nitzschia australis, Strain 10249 10 AB" /LENGTH=503 /DNA_ID=CAMNT_0008084605 /DNA_START=29 /DNA_END=1540 /DNA_ORIENTATION=-